MTFELFATNERDNVYNRCIKQGDNCDGCPYRYKCEDVFPVHTPWGSFTIPADFTLEDGFYVIERKR